MSAEQTKIDSWIETIVNVAIGYFVSLATWAFVIGPLFGITMSGGASAAVVSLFTITSIARQYTLRRAFNGRPIWATLKGKFA